MKSYFYIETAFHHQGDKEYLLELIDKACEVGVDGVKLQVLTKSCEFISTRHKDFELLSNFCLTEKEWLEIFRHIISKGLDIILMPLNHSTFDLIEDIPIRYIDIHSVSFNDQVLLNKIKETKIDVLLSIGGRFFDEVERLASFFEEQLKGLLVGFQGFPSNLEDVKLSRIPYFKNKYPDLNIGYADHSRYDEFNATQSLIYARLMGATVFEKHVTLSEGDLSRVDAVSAISFERLSSVIKEVRYIEDIVLKDTEILKHSDAEKKYRERELKVVATRNLSKQDKVSIDDLALKMISEDSESYNTIDDLVGKSLTRNIKKDEVILIDDII